MSKILDCGHEPSEHDEISTGYGQDKNDKTFCYACCAEQDRRAMDDAGKYTLYLVKRVHPDSNREVYYVTNWPGSLSYPVHSYKTSWHNMVGKDGRIDVWFKDHQGKQWHGYQIGQWNEVCYVKRVKSG